MRFDEVFGLGSDADPRAGAIRLLSRSNNAISARHVHLPHHTRTQLSCRHKSDMPILPATRACVTCPGNGPQSPATAARMRQRTPKTGGAVRHAVGEGPEGVHQETQESPPVVQATPAWRVRGVSSPITGTVSCRSSRRAVTRTPRLSRHWGRCPPGKPRGATAIFRTGRLSRTGGGSTTGSIRDGWTGTSPGGSNGLSGQRQIRG